MVTVSVIGNLHFNPRPPRRGRLTVVRNFQPLLSISIHAPREGGDRVSQAADWHNIISIHAPREGGDWGVPF